MNLAERLYNEGNFSTLSYLIKNNNIKNISLSTGDTLLHKASKDGNYTVAKQIVKNENYKYLINQQSKNNGDTPMMIAIKNGNQKIAKLLDRNGANKNITNFNGDYIQYEKTNGIQSETISATTDSMVLSDTVSDDQLNISNTNINMNRDIEATLKSSRELLERASKIIGQSGGAQGTKGTRTINKFINSSIRHRLMDNTMTGGAEKTDKEMPQRPDFSKITDRKERKQVKKAYIKQLRVIALNNIKNNLKVEDGDLTDVFVRCALYQQIKKEITGGLNKQEELVKRSTDKKILKNVMKSDEFNRCKEIITAKMEAEKKEQSGGNYDASSVTPDYSKYGF